MTRLGVITREINFSRMSEVLNASNKVMQEESDFRFLCRLGDEMRCAFRMGYGKSGLVASFVDYGYLATSIFPALVGGIPSSILKYKTFDANVLSYTWMDQSADATNGDGARIVMMPDGSTSIVRYVVEDEKVKTYRLVPEKIRAEYEKNDWKKRTDLLVDFLSVKDFEQVRGYFVEEVSTTAPQGSGVRVNAEMMGDPYMTTGTVIQFDGAFPDRILRTGGSPLTWWATNIKHTLSTSGYFISLEILDAYSFSPTGIRVM
jgi:hypothetical protein